MILDLREPYRRTIAVSLRLRLYLRHLRLRLRHLRLRLRHLRLRLYLRLRHLRLRRNPCFLQFFGPLIKSRWKGVHYNREILSPRTD
jgi:hypothetical protein